VHFLTGGSIASGNDLGCADFPVGSNSFLVYRKRGNVLLLNCGREIRYLAASSSAALEEANVGFGVTPLTGSGRSRSSG